MSESAKEFQGSAREFRPQKFEKLIGQDNIRQTLMNSLSSGTIAPAYLFSGTRGVGKTTTARILAKALNCEEGEELINEPCDKCSSCHEISISAHPDVLEVDGATYTGIENVRDLQERLVYLPSRGKYKCIILDEVHMLSKGAFNALLKTLEEPPPNVVFIFATTELRRVPDTIISRCQTFEFRRISTHKISEHLSDVIESKKKESKENENLEVEDSVLYSIARMSEGSIRDALSLLDQVLSFSGKERVAQEDIELVLGLPPSNVYSSILTAISKRDSLNSLKMLKDIYEQGHDLKVFSAGMLNYLRDLMVLKVAGKNDELFDISKDEIEEREEVLSLYTFEEVHHAYNILNGTISEASVLSSPYFTLEIALLRMCNMDTISSINDLLEEMKNVPSETKNSDGTSISQKVDIKKKEDKPINSSSEKKDTSRKNDEKNNSDEIVSSVGLDDYENNWESSKVEEAWLKVIPELRESRRALFHNFKIDFSESHKIKLFPVDPKENTQLFNMIKEEFSFLEEKLREIIPWKTKIILSSNESLKRDFKKPSSNLSVENDGKDIIQEVVDLFDGKVVDIRSHDKPT